MIRNIIMGLSLLMFIIPFSECKKDAELIHDNKDNKYGYVDDDSKTVVKHTYNYRLFFKEQDGTEKSL